MLWIIMAVLGGITFLLSVITGCWWYFEGFLIVLGLAALYRVIFPLMAPPTHGRRTLSQRWNAWWATHAGQVLRTIGVVLAIVLFVIGLFMLVPKLPSCAGSSTCGNRPAVTASGTPSAQPAVSAPSTVVTDLRAGQPSQWIHLDPATCVVTYQTVTETGDTTVINTGRDTAFVADGGKVSLGVVDSLQFWFKNRSGRLILTKAPKHGYAECKK